MKGKVYTTYFANVKNVPDGVHKIFVARHRPKGEIQDVIYIPDLAPSRELLWRYKNKEIEFSKFAELYLKELWEPNSQVLINKIRNNFLNDGKDVCFICYEKDFKECHRFLLASEFIKQGYEWEEM